MNYEKRPVNIKGWGMYQVDTNGVVYSKKDKPLKYSINPRGYCIVNFYHNHTRKGFAIHTLVAETFINGKTMERNQVNHKDGNTQNNCVDNLEWVTPKENTYHSIYVLGNDYSGSKSIKAKSIVGIDKYTNEIKYNFDSISDAAKFFVKINGNYRTIETCIWRVLKNKRKSYRGCIWKYKK